MTRVRVDRDEWYVWTIDKSGRWEVDVPDELLTRLREAEAAFDKAHDELYELVDAARRENTQNPSSGALPE